MNNEWRDGLPSVGAECEAFTHCHGGYAWLKVIFLHELNGKYAVLRGNILEWTSKIRPIKAEAEKLRDEQIEKMGRIAWKYNNYNQLTQGRHLYDEGCRMTRELTLEDIFSMSFGESRLTSCQSDEVIAFAKAIAAYVRGES